MFVCDFDEYHIQLDVANTCNIMSYAFMLIIHDNGITQCTNNITYLIWFSNDQSLEDSNILFNCHIKLE